MGKKCFFFDLDGTLTDPKIGITKSVQYSLQSFGIGIDNPDILVPFIGPPLRDSYKKFYSFSDRDAEKAVEKYREYFSKQGIYENALYGGIEGLLKEQKTAGKVLAVATSKPTVYAAQILKHFHIHGYFSFVAGSELDGCRSQKDLVIRYALDHLGIRDMNDVIMIGDREHDILGAQKLGIDGVGVLYGYGDFDELTKAGAKYIAASVRELSALLTGIG